MKRVWPNFTLLCCSSLLKKRKQGELDRIYNSKFIYCFSALIFLNYLLGSTFGKVFNIYLPLTQFHLCRLYDHIKKVHSWF